MATKTIDQISAQKQRLVQKNIEQTQVRRNKISTSIPKGWEKSPEVDIKSARFREQGSVGRASTARFALIERASAKPIRDANFRAIRARSVPSTAPVSKTAINTAAAGGDRYAKAWATRLAKYGPAGVSGGKKK